ncbi:DUF4412 domain-containing protein [Deferribacter abyssi]|uniref:DUF4412 domain-containing protein n=1 Tax=Deferribacter abyssi TaxID=213806 RepID=UPI003C1F36AA
MKKVMGLIIFIILSNSVIAGVIIDSVNNGTPSKTFIEGKLLKFKTKDFELIYNGKSKEFYQINHSQKQVMVITKQDINNFKAMMGNFIANQQTKTEHYTYKNIGRKKIAGCTCKGIKVLKNGIATEEIYFCNDKKLLKYIDKNLLKDFEEMTSFGSHEKSKEMYNSKLLIKYGYPFYIKNLQNGRIEFKVNKVHYKKLGKNLFTYPTSYEKRSIMNMFNNIPISNFGQ